MSYEKNILLLTYVLEVDLDDVTYRFLSRITRLRSSETSNPRVRGITGNVKPRLHDTTCYQSGCETGLTTGCIV